jgi:hypothetical protein
MIRVFNRLVLLIVGLGLTAGGLLVIIEAVWAWSGSGFVWIPGHHWLSSFETTAWSKPVVIGVSVTVAVVGAGLLVAQVVPQRGRVAPFRTDRAGEWQLLRRSTEAHLQRRLAVDVPTTPVRARLKILRRSWTLSVRARAATSSRPALEAAARAELAGLHAPGDSRVRVVTTRVRSGRHG